MKCAERCDEIWRSESTILCSQWIHSFEPCINKIQHERMHCKKSEYDTKWLTNKTLYYIIPAGQILPRHISIEYMMCLLQVQRPWTETHDRKQTVSITRKITKSLVVDYINESKSTRDSKPSCSIIWCNDTSWKYAC